jgi:hypothetical protein
MTHQRTVYISADSILQLLTHYSEGDLPLDATLKNAGVSQFMNRWIGFWVDSDQWRDAEGTKDGGLMPLHIRYEGKKVLVWGDIGSPDPVWRSGIEGPRRA